MQAAKDWILGASEDSGLAFYSAEGFLEAEEGEVPGQFPLATPPSRKAKRAAKPAVTPTGGGVPGERAKRVTTASLAASLDQLLAVVPALSSQIQTLSEKQQLLESRVVAPSRAGALGLSQPLSASLVPAAGGAQDVAKMFATPPPRTKEPGLLGLSKAQSHQPLELAALEEERAHATAPEGDLARAVLAQSQALTALLGQMAQSSEDPMMDLGATASSATRGALGRAKLQAELASHSGSFFDVGAEGTGSTHAASDFYHGLCGGFAPPGRQWHHVYGALRRFRPPPGLGPHPLPSDGGDGLHAGREPRGGEGRPGPIGRLHRPGCVMDGRRFDLAALLTLQEDPLSSIYINRQQSSLSRARAFSPLADQRWVTVALAFVKELGVILSKHLELTGAAPGSSKPQPSEAAAKSKPVPKKKGKGGGKAASSGQWPSSSGRGGGVADALPAKNQSMPAVSSPEGLEPNPLRDTMSFTTWAICLPRWILQSRSDFAWNLRRTFCFSTRQSKSLPTTAFPLPLPSLPEGVRVGSPKLSRRRFLKLCKARVLHVTVCALNQMYLGRFPTMDDLGRRPNRSQQAIVSRLRALIAVCGASNEPFPLAPGRSGPELSACLFQLEHFASHCPELQGSYLDRPVGFRENSAYAAPSQVP